MRASIAWMFVAFGIVGCTGEGDDTATAFCGDNACNGDEDTSSCPEDCPANQVCGDGTCSGTETTATCPGDCSSGGCTGNELADDTCTGENVCVNGGCAAAFGRAYRIIIGAGQMTAVDAVGDDWDAIGDPPDPMVTFSLNGSSLGSTPAAQDTYSPQWSYTFQAVIAAGSSYVIDVEDEDVAVNDAMFGCFGSVTVADIRRVYNTCASSSGSPAGVGSSITYWYEPQ